MTELILENLIIVTNVLLITPVLAPARKVKEATMQFQGKHYIDWDARLAKKHVFEKHLGLRGLKVRPLVVTPIEK